jgi:hypothetical protein
MNKTPLTRLRELAKILRNGDDLVPYKKELRNGFKITSLWHPKNRVIFLMNDEGTKNKIIYLEDTEVEDDEILEIVFDLEAML